MHINRGKILNHVNGLLLSPLVAEEEEEEGEEAVSEAATTARSWEILQANVTEYGTYCFRAPFYRLAVSIYPTSPTNHC